MIQSSSITGLPQRIGLRSNSGGREGMTRKQFIELHGATCDNWTWSWSFVNHKDRIVIFGAWEHRRAGTATMILDEAWRLSDAGKKQAAYPQSREHIRLVEEKGYALETFRMVSSDELKDEQGLGPSKIADFDEKLTPRTLKKISGQWFAIEMFDDTLDDLQAPYDYSALGSDGSSSYLVMKSYVRRDPKVRKKVIERATSGCERESCADTRTYSGFLDVHHILGVQNSDRYWNCVALCPNCHREAHFSPDKERINEELLSFASKYESKSNQV